MGGLRASESPGWIEQSGGPRIIRAPYVLRRARTRTGDFLPLYALAQAHKGVLFLFFHLMLRGPAGPPFDD
jgi:hypothetical protein